MALGRRVLSSRLLSAFGVYSLAGMLGSMVPFLAAPIYTRVLSSEEYGLVSMFLVLVALTRPFTGVSINGAISVKYVSRGEIDLPAYVTNGLGLLAISGIVVALTCRAGGGWIEQATSFPRQWLWVVVLTAAGQVIIQVALVLWQMQGRPAPYGAFQVAFALITGGLGVLLVVAFRLGWQGRVGGQLLGTMCFAALSLLVLWRNHWIRFSYNPAYVRDALNFGVPLIPHVIGAWVISMTDRLFIARYGSLSEVGVYSVGLQFAMVLNLLGGSFNQAYVPWLFERLKANRDKRVVVQLTYVYFVVMAVLALALAWLSSLVMKFYVGEEFVGAHRYVLWLGLGYAFNGMYKMVTNYIYYVQKTHILAWVTLLAAGANIVGNFILVPREGALGAAKAQAIAFLISFVLTWVLASRVYPMPWGLVGLRASQPR